MRWIDGAAWGALAVAAVAAGGSLLRPPPAAPGAPAGSGLRLGDALALVPSPCVPVPGRGRRLSFDPGPGARVVGLSTATVLPEEEGRPVPGKALDLELLQAPEGVLALGPWLDKAQPRGPVWLRYALVLEVEGRRRFRAGWTRFSPSDLAAADLRVQARRGATVTLRVVLPAGQAVPGATVSVSPLPLRPGAGSVLVATGASGEAVLEGLEADRDFGAELVEGVGPAREAVSRSFRGAADLVELAVPLAGAWRFEPFAVRRQVAGQAVMLEAEPATAGAPAEAFTVSRLVLPGTGAEAQAYAMWPSGAPRPSALRLRVHDGPVLALDLSAREPVLVLPPGATRARPRGPLR